MQKYIQGDHRYGNAEHFQIQIYLSSDVHLIIGSVNKSLNSDTNRICCKNVVPRFLTESREDVNDLA